MEIQLTNMTWDYSNPFDYMDQIQTGLQPLIITCAISGGVQGKEANSALPEKPEELAAEAAAAYNAGASIIHVHMRDPENWALNTMRLDVSREVNARIREACPDVIINNTTGGGPQTTMQDRFDALDALPEMASLNLGPDMSRFVIGKRDAPLEHPHEAMTFDQCAPYTYGMLEDLAGAMKTHGVKPEMETYHPGQYWVGRVLREAGLLEPPYVHQFVMGYQTSSFPTIPNLCALVSELPKDALFFTSGIGPFQLPMTTASIIMGGHARVGLEDNVYYSRGRKLRGNGEAVDRAVRIANEMNRPVASPQEARKMLGLSGSPRAFEKSMG